MNSTTIRGSYSSSSRAHEKGRGDSQPPKKNFQSSNPDSKDESVCFERSINGPATNGKIRKRSYSAESLRDVSATKPLLQGAAKLRLPQTDQPAPRKRGKLSLKRSTIKGARGGQKSNHVMNSLASTIARNQGNSDACDAKKTCPYHIAGNCKFGSVCRFSHNDEDCIPATRSSADETEVRVPSNIVDAPSSPTVDDFDLKRNQYAPPVMDECEVENLGPLIFVSRCGPGDYGVAIARWIVAALVLLFCEAMGVTDNVLPALFAPMLLLTLVMTVLLIMGWFLLQIDGITVCARLLEVENDNDDRCSSDRGKKMLKGKVYQIDRYVMKVHLQQPTLHASGVAWNTGEIKFYDDMNRRRMNVVSTLVYGFIEYVIFNVTHVSYISHLKAHGVTFGVKPAYQFISNSLLMELNSRKTMFTTDPAFNTLAQRTDNVSMYHKYLNEYGASVGNTTICIRKLQHASMVTQPFVNRLPSFVSSMDTAFTMKESSQHTQTSSRISGLTQEAAHMTSVTYDATLLLGRLCSIALVIACTALILVTLSMYLLDVRNASDSYPRDATVGSEGHSGDSQSFSSSSWSNEDSSSHLKKKRMFHSILGYREHLTQIRENSDLFIRKTISEETACVLLLLNPVMFAMLMMATRLALGLRNPGRRTRLTLAVYSVIWIVVFCATCLTTLDGSYTLQG